MASNAPALDYRPSYLAASVAAAAVLALYLFTLAPSTAMWDTSEYIAAAYTLGIPHPPGNPFFVLLGRVFTILPIAPSIAARVNILAALCSAVTAGIWFLVAERVLVGWLPQRWQRISGGALAALIGATAFTVWSQSVVNEKVYTVSLVGLALVSWLVVRWCDEPDAPRADRLIILSCYLMGLGYANHMAGILTLPAMVVAIGLRRPKRLLQWKLILACAGALALGATPFATQPIRAAHFPAVNEGEPTGCRDEISVGCTFSAKTYESFMYNFNRGQYSKLPVTQRQAPFSAQLGMWWYYFKWQWMRDFRQDSSGMQGALAAIFFSLGLLGAWVHYKRDRQSFTFFGPLMFTLTLLLIYYLNFKYGNTQPGPVDLPDEAREVRDRDYFYLWSFSAWSVWAALGLLYLWESIAALLGTEERVVGTKVVSIPKRTNWAIASPVLALAFIPLFANWEAASKRGEVDTAAFARDMLNSVEPYGILVAVGDNDTFPLWYAQAVEGVRPDVLIANTSLMNTDWFVRQMIRRPVADYNAEAGPEAYRGRTWPKPDGPPLNMTYDEADALPLYEQMSQPMQFVAEGGLSVTVDPANLPYPGVLQRADVLVYRLILDNPDRPVHFARSSGLYANELGFGDHLMMHGLTRKLVRDSIVESQAIQRVPGEGWVDVATSLSLWEGFDGPPALISKGKWIDQPSIGIPFLYVSSGMSLADALMSRGDTAEAEQVMTRARAVSVAVGLDRLFSDRPTVPPTAPLFSDTAVPPIALPPAKSVPPPTPPPGS